LKALGCERPDLAVSSHPHPDHLLGLVSVIREVGPKLLVLPESFKGDERYGPLLLAASEGGVPVRWVGPGAYELPECPGISIFSSPGPGENDKSLMVVAESGGEAVLVSGDVESRGQENILSLLPEGDFLAATAPHHGLPDAFLRAFWEKVRPRKILVSSQNGGKSPCAELRGIAGEQSASIFTTGEVGYILAEFGGTDAEPKAAR
ncbi:MBL fold metallo-hydrolase, partial [bacterium]